MSIYLKRVHRLPHSSKYKLNNSILEEVDLVVAADKDNTLVAVASAAVDLVVVDNNKRKRRVTIYTSFLESRKMRHRK